MTPIFTISVAASLLIVMLPPLTSARALGRHVRQTGDAPFTVDTRLFSGLDLLEVTTCLLNGRHQLEVERICKVFEAVKDLEESLNEASDIDISINETAAEVESMMCNKLQPISTFSYNNLAPDCSDDKFQLVCSRAPIGSKARDAALAIRSSLGMLTSDQRPQWIDEHIEDDDVKYFICKRVLFGQC